MHAILDNTPGVSIEVEVFSPELAALSPAAAGERVARALAHWQRTLDDALRAELNVSNVRVRRVVLIRTIARIEPLQFDRDIISPCAT